MNEKMKRKERGTVEYGVVARELYLKMKMTVLRYWQPDYHYLGVFASKSIGQLGCISGKVDEDFGDCSEVDLGDLHYECVGLKLKLQRTWFGYIERHWLSDWERGRPIMERRFEDLDLLYGRSPYFLD